MRLQSFLSQSGVASRRNVIDELEAGKVKVNGEVVRIPSYPIYPDKDEVTYEGTRVSLSAKKLHFIFHKPTGVITTVTDTHGRKTVLDFFKHIKERLYPIGRLDQDTTGLLIVTNDGDLANKLMHPRYGIRKVYEVLINKEISREDIRRLENGVDIEGGFKTSHCRIKFLDLVDGKMRLEITLHEGKKRQIRLMFKAIGAEVISLHRKFYGPLDLKGLPAGKFRELSEQEVLLLKKTVSQAPVRRPRRPVRPKKENHGKEEKSI